MFSLVAFALLAGCLTILAPYTLPVVPFVLGAASGQGRRRVLGVVIGFSLARCVAGDDRRLRVLRRADPIAGRDARRACQDVSSA